MGVESRDCASRNEYSVVDCKGTFTFGKVPRELRRVPSPRGDGSGGTSNWGEPTGFEGGGAGSFSASPTANPAGLQRRTD
jgi:hypothetical protein